MGTYELVGRGTTIRKKCGKAFDNIVECNYLNSLLYMLYTVIAEKKGISRQKPDNPYLVSHICYVIFHQYNVMQFYTLHWDHSNTFSIGSDVELYLIAVLSNLILMHS